MIPIYGWAAPPALFTILPMPANTGPGSRPWRTASPLSSDIVTVEFSDTQHGKLITADRETWSTSDAGNTWQRQ